MPDHLQTLQDAARRRGVELSVFGVAGLEGIVPAIDAAKAAGAEALNFLATPLFSVNSRVVFERVAALRMPAIYQWAEMAEDGGLVAYGARFTEVFRQRARLLVKVLRGAKPADIPVEQPTRFELVINLKTAKAIGHEIPGRPRAARRQADRMKRREFITLLGGAAIAAPLAARAQQGTPVIGFLHSAAPGPSQDFVATFRRGLSERGFVEGRNATIEFRWAEGQFDRLPALAADLLRRQPAVIVAFGPPAAMAAKAATSTVPVVFTSGDDPVRTGLVASLNRPGANVTGVYIFADALEAKRLELLTEMVPHAALIAVLVNSASSRAANQIKDTQAAAATIGRELVVLTVGNEREFESAFETIATRRAGALLVGSDIFFGARGPQLVALAARHKLPAIYEWRQSPLEGGLMSYGADFTDLYHQAGNYAGQIAGGRNPADLPVMQSDQVRAGHQPEDRQGARPHRAADAARPRRRGDRINR